MERDTAQELALSDSDDDARITPEEATAAALRGASAFRAGIDFSLMQEFAHYSGAGMSAGAAEATEAKAAAAEGTSSAALPSFSSDDLFMSMPVGRFLAKEKAAAAAAGPEGRTFGKPVSITVVEWQDWASVQQAWRDAGLLAPGEELPKPPPIAPLTGLMPTSALRDDAVEAAEGAMRVAHKDRDKAAGSGAPGGDDTLSP